MSIPWDWIVTVLMLGGFGYAAYRYYRGQSARYSHGEHNTDMDRFRDGGCCH